MVPNAADFGEWYFLNQEFEKAKQQAEKKTDLIRELLSDLEEKQAGAGPFEIDQYFKDRLEAAENQVDQVRKEIKIRQALTEQFIQEIDSQISYAALSLEKFSGWAVGYNTGVDVRRNHLERLLQQLRQERRASELRAWDDLVKLRGELRDAVKEYNIADRVGRPWNASTA